MTPRDLRRELTCAQGSLRAVSHIELGQDARDVVLHRSLGQAELIGDLLVRSTGAAENLALAATGARPAYPMTHPSTGNRTPPPATRQTGVGGRFSDTDPSGIRINSLSRDRWNGDDALAIYVDAFNDNQNAK